MPDKKQQTTPSTSQQLVLLMMLAVLAFFGGMLIFRDNTLPTPPSRDDSLTRPKFVADAFHPIDLDEHGQPTDMYRRMERKLDELSAVDFEDVPLSEALDFLATNHAIEFQLDVDASEVDFINEHRRVTLQVSGITLCSLLRHLLRRMQLEYAILDDHLTVMSEGEFEESFRTVIYPIGDLVHSRSDVDELVDIIEYLCGWIWQDNLPEDFDRHDYGTKEYLPESKSLKITHNQRIHDLMEEILFALRHPLEPGQTIDDFARTPMEKKIRDELQRVVTLDYENTPLRDVLHEIAARHGIPIIDDWVLMAEGISLQQPVSIKYSNLTLANALRGMLRLFGLDYIVKDEVLIITASYEAMDEMRCHTYRIDDLIERNIIDDNWPIEWNQGHTFEAYRNNAIRQFFLLIHLIPNAGFGWGGDNDRMLTFFPAGQCLFINNSREIHRKTAYLLDNLRAARVVGEPFDLLAPPGRQAKRQQTLTNKLNQRVTINFDKAPLQTVVQELSRRFDLNITCDPHYESSGPDQLLLSGKFKNVRLATALKTMLRKNELIYSIEDDMVFLHREEVEIRAIECRADGSIIAWSGCQNRPPCGGRMNSSMPARKWNRCPSSSLVKFTNILKK